MVAWMLGSAAGYAIGARQGRSLLERLGGWNDHARASWPRGNRLRGRHGFLATVTMPAFVPGIFRIRFALFMMGALAAGAFWIGAYVVVSYFLGAKIAGSIGDAGSMTILGVVVIVAAGLIIRAGLAKWRSARPARPRVPLLNLSYSPTPPYPRRNRVLMARRPARPPVLEPAAWRRAAPGRAGGPPPGR